MAVCTDRLYADGRPFDELRYLQSKITLQPDRFTSVKAFREFGKLVRRTAKDVGVQFDADADGNRRPGVREILFVDTPDFRLTAIAAIAFAVALRGRINPAVIVMAGSLVGVAVYGHS